MESLYSKKVLFDTNFLCVCDTCPLHIYIFALTAYRIKLARLAFQIWTIFILLILFSVTNKFLNKFSGFWTGVFPYAFITICMLIGLKGIGRIKGEQFDIDKTTKIPKSYNNLRILISSIDTIILFLSAFIIMVLIGKYFESFILDNWQSLNGNKILLFYIGMIVGFYPSYILGAAISCVFTFLVNLIFKYLFKLPIDRK